MSLKKSKKKRWLSGNYNHAYRLDTSDKIHKGAAVRTIISIDPESRKLYIYFNIMMWKNHITTYVRL